MPGLGALEPVYFHLFMLGWVLQLIFGVAWWMFPILSREKPRGNEAIGWVVFYALNSGLILRAVAEPMRNLSTAGVWQVLLVISAVLQMIAGWTFVICIWPRVKGKQAPAQKQG